MKSQIERVLDAWQSLDNATRNVSTALPFQLSERVATLEEERTAFVRILTKIMREQAKL